MEGDKEKEKENKGKGEGGKGEGEMVVWTFWGGGRGGYVGDDVNG